ncbi:alpha/beta fold hydrolase [Stappia sp.]|uniref:alpha/beta fold hydrolase n=1 Tax=Stappia sp. TaxID=1870903 RepID=UPI003A98D557
MASGLSLTLLAVAGILGALGLSAQVIGRAAEAKYPPVGQIHLVAGQGIHVLDQRPEDWRPGDPTLVFLHGASGNLLDMRMAFLEPLSRRGYRMIFVDRPGHGHSERGGPGMYSPARQAEVVASLLEGLGIDRAVAVGHSWGGAVVAQLALQEPDRINGIVFIAPATHPWPGGVNWYYTASTAPILGPLFAYTLAPNVAALVAPSAVEGVFSPEAAPRDYGERIGLALLFRPASFLANARDVGHLKGEVEKAAPLYPNILQPAAIVTGDADTVVLPEIHSAGLLRDLPNAWRVDLPGAGHMPHHTRTQDVIAEIDRVVAKAFPNFEPPATSSLAKTKKAARTPAA